MSQPIDIEGRAREIAGSVASYAETRDRILSLVRAAVEEARSNVDMRPSIGYVPWNVAIDAALTFAARPLHPEAANHIHRWIVARVDEELARRAGRVS